MKQKDLSAGTSRSTKPRGFNLILLILSAALVAYIAYPLASILTLIEPVSLLESIARPQIGNSFLLSLATATISTLLVALFGIPLAYSIARYHFRGKFLLRLIIIIPLVLPPLASGALLLGVYGPYSPLGGSFPVEFTQSVIGIIIAQSYVASPFMILPAQAAFESIDTSYEKVARTLGKNRMQTFLQVSLPLAKTGIVVGFIMAWVRAVGELGATMMMAYNPHTISIQIFEDNAVGGLQHAVPGILLVILLSIMVLAVFSIVRKGEGLKIGW
ncbi:MAG: ABC transporter permease [Nitrososphaerales archaeon]